MHESVLSRLRDLPHVAATLDALAAEAGVHVVGGAVRDALLGRVPTEVDLVVEGDAAAVARRAAARLGGEALVHERFGTATVRAATTTFDLASARRERYVRPGALPEVEPGATIEQDLRRRDFTVNAVAVRLRDGHLTAHATALADLDALTLRVLHPGSFRDDPTRLLRMCRYAARLGLSVEPTTAALAAQAVEAGALATVSGERLGRELRRLAAEPQPSALELLGWWGIGAAALHPAFAVDSELTRRAFALCPPDGRADLLALAASLLGVATLERAERLDQLSFDARERDLLVAVCDRAPFLATELAGSVGYRPSQLCELLERAAPETVALAGALADDAGSHAARRWLTELRHVRTAITGSELKAAGLTGPAVGRGLRAARAAALDGLAPRAEQQLAIALAASEPV